MQLQQQEKSKMATLKELQKKIALQEAKNRVARKLQSDKDTIRGAKEKLRNLKFGPAKSRGKKLKALSKRFGKGLLKTGKNIGKKVGPAIIKQAKLIKEQQLRDDALEKARLRTKPPVRTSKRSKSKVRKKSKGKTSGTDIFDIGS